MLLRAYYITAPVITYEGATAAAWESHKRKTCRFLGIPHREWEYGVKRATLMIGNRLR